MNTSPYGNPKHDPYFQKQMRKIIGGVPVSSPPLFDAAKTQPINLSTPNNTQIRSRGASVPLHTLGQGMVDVLSDLRVDFILSVFFEQHGNVQPPIDALDALNGVRNTPEAQMFLLQNPQYFTTLDRGIYKILREMDVHPSRRASRL